MPHRELLLKISVPPVPAELWSRRAARDLQAAIHFVYVAGKNRANAAVHAGALLGALISYSRPFTERADPAMNPTPAQHKCFLGLAADLGADLLLHGKLLRVRDEVMALSDLVSLPEPRLNARRFKSSDSGVTRITRSLNQVEFCRLATSMRVACDFFQSKTDTRLL